MSDDNREAKQAVMKKLVLKRRTLGRVISFVESAYDTNTCDVRIESVLTAIQTGGKKLKGKIQQIRNRFEAELAITGDPEKAKLAVDPLKKQLHAVAWSGRFS